MSRFTLATILGAAATVSAHGRVSGFKVNDGAYIEGYNPNWQYSGGPPATSVGWNAPATQGNGFVDATQYGGPDIICHTGATPANASIPVNGGDKLAFLWGDGSTGGTYEWPLSHQGPVNVYLAKCPGDCSTVDKTTLSFFKTEAVGLISATGTNNGDWATDTLRSQNQSWITTIPSDIASGNYVARQEIIALHSAGTAGGAQVYPYCVNLKITTSGTLNPAGESAEKFYTETSPGMVFNLYGGASVLSAGYPIPGPAVYSGGSSGSAPAAPASSAASSSAAAPTTTVQPATIAAPTTTSAIAVVSTTAAAAPTTLQTTTSAASTPSDYPGTGSGSSSGSSKPLPDGTTLEDVLAWLQDLFAQRAARKLRLL